MDLYGILCLSLEQKRIRFALNDLERGIINSLVLARLLEHFKEECDDKKLDIIKQVSPVAWHNINLNGTYSFSFEQDLLDLDEITQSIMQNEN
jgi:hypothetical protein